MKNFLLALLLITTKSGFCQETKLLVENSFPVFKYQINDTTFISNKDFIGKITFINYWFKACHPCIAELAGLNKCYNLLKEDKNFQFISFSTDTSSVIAESKEKFKINFSIYHLDKKQAQELHFLAAPTNLIIDKKRHHQSCIHRRVNGQQKGLSENNGRSISCNFRGNEKIKNAL